MEPGSSKLDTILNKASTVLKVSAEKGADLLFTSVIRDSVRPGMNLKNVFLLLGHILISFSYVSFPQDRCCFHTNSLSPALRKWAVVNQSADPERSIDRQVALSPNTNPSLTQSHPYTYLFRKTTDGLHAYSA